MGNRKKISAKAATYTAEQTEAYLAKRKARKAERNALTQKLHQERLAAIAARKAAETARLAEAKEAKVQKKAEWDAYNKSISKKSQNNVVNTKPSEAWAVLLT